MSNLATPLMTTALDERKRRAELEYKEAEARGFLVPAEVIAKASGTFWTFSVITAVIVVCIIVMILLGVLTDYVSFMSTSSWAYSGAAVGIIGLVCFAVAASARGTMKMNEKPIEKRQAYYTEQLRIDSTQGPGSSGATPSFWFS